MFGYDRVETVTVCLSDLTADTTIPIFRFPSRGVKFEILKAWAVTDTTIADGAGTAFTLRLLDYGAGGTAVAGTVSAALGAAGTGDWTGETPRDFTISEGTIDAGDYVCLAYDETGTVAPLNIIVAFEYVQGVGA